MTKDEALKLALEALEAHADIGIKSDKAINAIKEALALPQRTWVGLTNNDLQPIAEEYRILFGSWVHDFARAIEAKLKEKNP
jgi:hypothetical protein